MKNQGNHMKNTGILRKTYEKLGRYRKHKGNRRKTEGINSGQLVSLGVVGELDLALRTTCKEPVLRRPPP